MLIAVLLIMVSWRIGIETGSQQVRSELQQAQTNYEALQTNLTQLTAQAQEQQVTQRLSREVERLELEIAASRSLLQEFSSFSMVSQVNFGSVLSDLAYVHVDGIWLTRIVADENGVEIYGKTLQPATIPEWISGFTEAPTLEPFQFSVVALQRDQQNVLNFGIVSKARSQNTSRAALEPEEQ